MAELVERLSPVWGDPGFQLHEFKPWFSQTDDLKIVTCHYLAQYSALLGYDKGQWNEEN